MSREKPDPIDFTGTKYDALETALSNLLNIKVILVRDWETPEQYSKAESDRWYYGQYGTPETKVAVEDYFQRVEAWTLATLRAKVAERDVFVGHDLSENDLRSLKTVGHVTLRQGNAEPEEAVLIFDPARKFKDFPDDEPVLSRVLNKGFDNAWHDLSDPNKRGDDAGKRLNVRDFIENFDIDAEDMRAYDAVLRVRMALQNQSHFNNLGKNWYYEPSYFRFAGLAQEKSDGWKSDSETPIRDVVEKYRAVDRFPFEDIGVKDKELNKKLLLAAAVHDLVWSASAPNATFARLGMYHAELDQKEIIRIQDELRKKLREGLASRRPAEFDEKTYIFSMDSMGLSDYRVLFPIFREVYEKDTSTGLQREYYDTIMEGLQKWFPTLTNGPVPELDYAKEPPRGIAEMKAPAAPAAAFTEAAAPAAEKPEEKPATKPKRQPRQPKP